MAGIRKKTRQKPSPESLRERALEMQYEKALREKEGLAQHVIQMMTSDVPENERTPEYPTTEQMVEYLKAYSTKTP